MRRRCVVCSATPTHARRRCQTCYRYLHRTGRDRSYEIISRLTERDIAKALHHA